MPNTYIALDIETTGFNPWSDNMIEFAAIKFKGEEIIDRYETLINPEQDIPMIVAHMTGIKNADVSTAPRFEEVKDKIAHFIGNYPIIGHNISFDVNFLTAKGVPIEQNPLFDTLQLASIFLPGLPSYSLDTLTRTLNILHDQKHRAMSDTIASQRLFNILNNKINELDSTLLEQILLVTDKSTWALRELFKQKLANRDMPITPQQQTEFRTSGHFDYVIKEEKKLTKEDVNNFYTTDGPLSKIIDHYEQRASQPEITEKILHSFTQNRHLLIEAGTGTGKTVAYLLAAIHYAKQNNEKIIISTYTKTLQEQLIDKDIPLLSRALEQISPDIGFTATLLKGKKNYISLKKLHNLMQKPLLEDHEVTFIIKLLVWLTQTATGDLEEVNLQGKEYGMKDEVCFDDFSDPDEEYQGVNFLKNARQKAERSDIIIVNHALLLQDAFFSKGIIPDYNYLILDEAHHLEDATTDTLTILFSLHSFLRPYEKIQKALEESQNANGPMFENKDISEIKTGINNLISRVEIFFGILGIFAEKNADPFEYQSQFIIQPHSLNTTEWHKFHESAKIIHQLLSDLLTECENKSTTLNQNLSDHGKQLFSSALAQIEQQKNDLHTAVLSGQTENRITWTFKTGEGHTCLKSAPVNAGENLKEAFYNTKHSVIFTSATLTTDGNFNFFRDRVQLNENFEEIHFASHFDYPDQVKILIPEDMPRPNTEGYFRATCDIISQIVESNKGRTLILFTSKKALTATYMSTATALKEKGFEILAQGVTGGKGKIIEHFKQEPTTTAIYGLNSFWEGVDIPGNLITCVIIQKLPFDPPNDPLIFARCQKYKNAFSEFQLPRAILKFKQGFGRLIRSHQDKGSIVILDSRIIQNGYGAQFLHSLPEGISIDYANCDRIGKAL